MGDHSFLAGAIAGLTSRIVTAPLDVVKIRMQLQQEPIRNAGKGGRYTGLLQAFADLYAEEGFRTFYRGNMPAVLLYGAYGAVQFRVFSMLQSVEGVPSMVSGLCAGAVATMATYPLDLLRTRLAGQGVPKRYPTVVEMVRGTLEHHGVHGMYKGLTPTLIQIAPFTGIQFAAYGALQSFLQQWNMDSFSSTFCIGGAAGVAAKVCVYPLELAKRRMQISGLVRDASYGASHEHIGLLQCLSGTLRNEGPGGLYKGLSPTLLKSAISSATTFAVYESCMRFFSDGH